MAPFPSTHHIPHFDDYGWEDWRSVVGRAWRAGWPSAPFGQVATGAVAGAVAVVDDGSSEVDDRNTPRDDLGACGWCGLAFPEATTGRAASLRDSAWRANWNESGICSSRKARWVDVPLGEAPQLGS